ncbi:AAEL006746-PA [Aedes aegypti]|uniref:AAEL006746-PA n=1 Tax=Aedes aegypti TaxID=7159 RepID=Q174X9_AEDAE|nr:AAEL006746-PA [Aedes aegypti]
MKFLYCVLLLFLAINAGYCAAIPVDAESNAIGDRSNRMFVQVLNCTSPNCKAQCRGRGYRTGQCQIGRCFCSYV